VTSVSGKPLSIAFEEVAQSKVTYHRPDAEELAAEAAALADAESMGFLSDPFASAEVGDVIGILGDTTVAADVVEESDDAS
jgi:hypothetical protein